MQVVLGTRTYEPVAVAFVVPPDDDALTCAERVTLQPRLPAGTVAESAPDGDTVPEKVPSEPESAEIVPWSTPLVSVNVSVPLSVDPSDWPPFHVPAYSPSNWPAPVLCVNDPVTILSALITIEHGLAGPVQSPLQPVKFDPDAGVAAMLTVAPSS